MRDRKLENPKETAFGAVAFLVFLIAFGFFASWIVHKTIPGVIEIVLSVW